MMFNSYQLKEEKFSYGSILAI